MFDIARGGGGAGRNLEEGRIFRGPPLPFPAPKSGAGLGSSACGPPPSRTKAPNRADRGFTGGLVAPALGLLGAEANTSGNWWFSGSRHPLWQVRSTVKLSVLL